MLDLQAITIARMKVYRYPWLPLWASNDRYNQANNLVPVFRVYPGCLCFPYPEIMFDLLIRKILPRYGQYWVSQ